MRKTPETKEEKTMYEILKAKSDGLRAEATRFAAELVRTPSASLSETAVADLLEKRLTALGYDKVVRDEAGNVLGILFGREAGPAVLLTGHMDTALVGTNEDWGSAPCSGRTAGGRLHGRGAADCKGGIAAQVYAGVALRRSFLPMRGHVIVAATVAEENGGSAGVRALLGQTLPSLDLKPAYALLGEPTDLGLYYGHDGWMEMDVTVEGADPFGVDDAARAIEADFREMLAAAPEGNVQSMAVASLRFDDGGGSRRARLRLARRLRAADDAQAVLAGVQREAQLALKGAGAGARVSVAVHEEDARLYTGRTSLVRHLTHAWQTDPFHPLMERARQSLAAAGCPVRPGRWQLGRLGLGTAGGVLLNEFQVPVIGYGPGHEDMAHAVNESVSLDAIATALYGTAAIVHSLAGVPVFGWTSDEI